MTPLAKRKPGRDGYVERFEGYVAGMEVCNAFTELNDPIEQRRRFEEQEEMREQHAQEDFDRLDEEFLTAVEYGMPPTGGLGMGIDRLAMLFSGQSTVREVVLFPHLSRSQDELFWAVEDHMIRGDVHDGTRSFSLLQHSIPNPNGVNLAESWKDLLDISWGGAFVMISLEMTNFPWEALLYLFRRSMPYEISSRVSDGEIRRIFEDYRIRFQNSGPDYDSFRARRRRRR